MLLLLLSFHLFWESFLSSLFIRPSSSSIHYAPVGSTSRRWQKGQKANRFSSLWLFQFTTNEMWYSSVEISWGLPSLISFRAEYLNFYAISHVELNGWFIFALSFLAIPYPPPGGYWFGDHVFEYVITLDATCILLFCSICSFSWSC